MPFSRLLALALAIAAPFALAACGDAAESGTATAGEPLPTVAAPAGTTWSQKVSTTEAGGFLVGNPDAPLKLVEYGSLTCPACARFSMEGIQPLLNQYVDSGRVSFEFRSFVIHGPLDLALTRMISCTSPEAAIPLADQIWANLVPIQQRAFANQDALAGLDQVPADQRYVQFGQLTGLYDFFAARGISEDQARSCMGDMAALDRISKHSADYSEDGINQTPTFVLNGNKLEASSWAELEPQLQRAGAR
ncbi:MAG: thioredoxin domain-containing protein [Porphyrobacter sp.]|nr:thioredoxin domain-containing protein [Porphyrobacter sp.]